MSGDGKGVECYIQYGGVGCENAFTMGNLCAVAAAPKGEVFSEFGDKFPVLRSRAHRLFEFSLTGG